MTAINTVAPALIAGNAVVLKHATQTLLVGERMVRAFTEAGVPADIFQNLFLDHETTSAMIAGGASRFRKLHPVPLAAVARWNARRLGPSRRLRRNSAGKTPGYVRADADLDAAVDTLIDGAMFNSGQCCCGIERIYVHESLFDGFVEKAVAIVSAYKLGDPAGPGNHARSHGKTCDSPKRCGAQISEALADGATALIETMAADDGGAYLSPQILTNVTHDMRVMRDESFGPVVGIMAVKDDDEAIRLMNDSEFGLTASIWTQDIDAALEIGARIETGTVFLNRADYLDPALCWTGCKNTGKGGALGVIGYQNLTRPKSYHFKKVTT